MALAILSRIVVGSLLIIHGFAHYNLPSLWGSRPEIQSWLLRNLGQPSLRSIGGVMWISTLLIFLVAGIVTFTNQPLWRILTIAGSVLSLLTMLLFWDGKMILGVVVNVAVLIGLIVLQWPPASFIR